MDRDRRLDFLIMGAHKSGTSALSYFLSQHSDIYIPEKKEIHFFDRESVFKRSNGSVDYARYHKEFEVPRGVRLIGESTPIYMYWKPAARRIMQYNASIKMIFILRNPIDRAYAHYNWAKDVMEDETQPFAIALRLEKRRLFKSLSLQTRIYSYTDRGYYAQQIKRLLEYFPVSQMLFIKNEELRNDHSGTLNRTFSFLEVTPVDYIEPVNVNSNHYPPMSATDRKYLLKKFKRDIEELEKILNWDCSDWLTGAHGP
jgi:hypothetical protein